MWAWSRHPNYFGEMLLTWGLFVLGAAQYEASSSRWGYVTVPSPLFTMFILLLGSGMPTAEGDYQKRFMRPPAQREAFLLHQEGGLSVAEIAAATQTAAETAKSRLRYARATLRQTLEGLL